MNTTDICNMALAYLGKPTIDHIDEDTELARSCKLHYDQKRQLLLREYNWNFATKTAKLVLHNDNVHGWDCVYAKPLQALAIRRVYSAERARAKYDSREDFTLQLLEDNTMGLCCNVTDAICDYTYDMKDETVYPMEFIEALAHYLAYAMAQSLVGSEAKAQAEYEYMRAAIVNARYHDAIEQERAPKRPTGYFDVRA